MGDPVLKMESLGRKVFPLLAAFLMMGAQLLVQPIIGLSDNGDYFNVTAPYQLEPEPRYETTRYFTHIVPRWFYDTSVPEKARLLTSEIWVVRPLVIVTRRFFDGVFDLRWMGLVHMLILLAAMVAVEPVISRLPRPRQLLVWAALIVVFCDATYTAHLNSFYMDAASFVWLMLAAALYVRFVAMPGPSLATAIGFVVVTLLFLTSKLQHAYLFPAFVAVLVFDRRFRQVLPLPVWVVSILATVGVTLPMFDNAPAGYGASAAFNVVFDDLLENNDPQEVLRHFGLPPELESQKGLNGFSPNSALRDPRYRDLLLANLTHGKLLHFYLKRPDEMFRLIGFALTECSREREQGMGNFAPDVGRAPREQSGAYAFYSDFKRFVFYPRPWLYGPFLAAVMLGVLRLGWLRTPYALPGLLAVSAMAAFEFGVSALADVAETDRHLFLFRAMQDLLLVSLVGLLLLPKTERGAVASEPLRPSSRQSG